MKPTESYHHVTITPCLKKDKQAKTFRPSAKIQGTCSIVLALRDNLNILKHYTFCFYLSKTFGFCNQNSLKLKVLDSEVNNTDICNTFRQSGNYSSLTLIRILESRKLEKSPNSGTLNSGKQTAANTQQEPREPETNIDIC